LSESETIVSWQFIGRRLDAVQADTADIRRRVISQTERFNALENTISERFTALDNRVASLDRRLVTLEARMDAMVERQSRLDTTAARTLFLLQRLALKIGGIEDEPAP
jgi:uncharacterized protein YPO0396